MNIVSLIIEAISGAVGGNVAGAAMKENSLGTMGNSIAGIVGGDGRCRHHQEQDGGKVATLTSPTSISNQSLRASSPRARERD